MPPCGGWAWCRGGWWPFAPTGASQTCRRGVGVGGAEVAEDPRLKVPQMGWNALDIQMRDNGDGPRSPLMAGLEPGAHVYFVHGYYCTPDDPAVVAATANYGGDFCAAFSAGSVHACQFHPEKSQAVGLKILDNFARLPA